MHKIKAVSLAILGVLFLRATDRSGKIVSHSMTFPNNVTLHIDVVAEPSWHPSAATAIGYSNGKLHRFIYDDVQKVYFGYDLTPETLPDGRIRIGIDPLSLTVDELDAFVQAKKFSSFRPIIPRFPSPQLVNAGDTIAFDVLVSPGGKQKIVDYIDVSRRPN